MPPARPDISELRDTLCLQSKSLCPQAITWVELPSHLYGCLRPDDLKWLAARNTPRWEIFTNSYRNAFGREPDIKNLLGGDAESDSRLESYYYFKAGWSFCGISGLL